MVDDFAKLLDADFSPTEFLLNLDGLNRSLDGEFASAFGSRRLARTVLLKASNIAVTKYHYQRRDSQLISRPVGLTLDPCNSCQLKCPGCAHAGGMEGKYDWVPGNLKEKVFDGIMEEYGPYAISSRLFNWGEPPLNKNTPSSYPRRSITCTVLRYRRICHCC